ncbi:MAG: flagellar assembly protein FliW [Gemmatimonadota bacterium]|nr:flagellar assembly protein FliW [Gemmatimonadota bacterium]MDH5758247.1 flagellar assembly protein FliW [Gemmatimonadota bacterium]
MNAVAMVDSPDSSPARVESKLLGSLDVPAGQRFSFPQGIFGFPEARTFGLIPAEKEGIFWLQSMEFEALTFLLIDPFAFVDDYAVDLGPQELGELMPADASDLLVLSILTLPRQADEAATTNLQGPLALNLGRRLGRQVVIQDSPFGIRHPVDVRGKGERA